MKETLLPSPPAHMQTGSAGLPHARGFKSGRARIGVLLVLLAAGFGLLAWTALPGGRTQNGGAQPARDYLPRDEVPSLPRSLQEILAHPDIIPTHNHPLLRQPAPDFELADPEGKVWNLGELRDGHPVVLLFYYGFHCIHCVRQLSDVNRDLPLFGEVGARVIAISADPPELTRQRFQQNGRFGFPVLADPGNKVAQAYRVFRRAQDGTMADIHRHGTFVINRDGMVQWANVGDAPLRRNPALFYQLAKIGGIVP
jgi:thioredoxin-dependent peroxiredoxin